jgi:ribonuclease HI
MYFDGSKRIQGAGAGVVLISPQGDKLKYVLRMSFPQASNNEAEYEALLHGMKMAKACGATRLKIFGDSNLVVQQVMNKCDAISDNMTMYRNLYYYLEGTFDGCEVSHISRASNEEADNLSNIGSQCLPVPQGVFWEEIIERSIKNSKTSTIEEQGQHQATGSGDGKASIAETEEVMMIEETWMQPYLAYMINKTLPEDTVEAKRIIRRSKAFVVLQGKLYKKSISGVLQRCVTPQEGQEILKDIHAGVCGHHASSRAIAAKAFRAGFYWLTAIEDAKDIVQKCEACQRFASRPHAPAAELQQIPLS